MLLSKRRMALYVACAATTCALILIGWRSESFPFQTLQPQWAHDDFPWRNIDQHYPITSFRPLPTGKPKSLPKVQAKFPGETNLAKQTRMERQKAVKDVFLRCWTSYKEKAWLRDEVTPVTGTAKDSFGGWGATLVDSLDTLWIMDLKDEFYLAVDAVDRNISFATTTATEISVFETSIRFLGGLLSAYDLSGDHRLLSKARDVGDMLYKAFDTPNHIPNPRWNIQQAAHGVNQSAPDSILLAELGSFSLDFTRLSLLTRDPKYYEIVARITDMLHDTQMKTKLPGMWPTKVGTWAGTLDKGNEYTLGAEADSAIEYTAKMVALVGGQLPQYEDMYTRSIDTAVRHVFFRPMTPRNDDILVSGTARVDGNGITTESTAQHLSCFAGGLLALGGRLVGNSTHVELAAKLARGCVWLYSDVPLGIMPEACTITACPDPKACDWAENLHIWHKAVQNRYGSSSSAEDIIAARRLPPGFIDIYASYYILRPEAIESVFVLYRATADTSFMDHGWEMWNAINNATKTELANSALVDVNPENGKKPQMSDSMESFWLSETLKYFYLLYSEPDLISLDDWVFNTEAHPFRRMKP